MKFTIKHLWILFAFLSLGTIMSCSEKENNIEPSYGEISGRVQCISGKQGFKVTLVDIDGVETPQIAVTSANGDFYFETLKAGKYKIDVQRNGFEWGGMSVDGEMVYNSHVFNVYQNQTTYIEVLMNPTSEYTDDEITVTDINGNPIGDAITVPKYTTTIAIKLYNGTSQNVNWDLTHIRFVSGYRDTTVGNYNGFTYHTFDFFNEVSPSTGTLTPGDITIITGIINPDIYTLDRLHESLTTMTLTTYSSTHAASKDIGLYLPWGD